MVMEVVKQIMKASQEGLTERKKAKLKGKPGSLHDIFDVEKCDPFIRGFYQQN